jgi:hypothetical protein
MLLMGCGMADRERNFAQYSLPKGIKALLFPFVHSRFTLHNIVYQLATWLLIIMFQVWWFSNREMAGAFYFIGQITILTLNVVCFVCGLLVTWQ